VLFHLVLADTEFPNDNPSLSDPCGVLEFGKAAALAAVESAVELDVEVDVAVAVAVATVTAAEVAEPVTTGDDDEAEIEIVEQFDPVEFEVATPPASAETACDPFAIFVKTLVEVAHDAGCARAAALLPALLEGGQVEAGAFPEATVDGLVLAGVLARSPSGLVGGEAFRRTAEAWRAILRGDSEDFSACGSRMLDEWAADLVARIVAAPARTEQLRRELRTRGVAAFGLVLAA
jgi:hypothetical protein